MNETRRTATGARLIEWFQTEKEVGCITERAGSSYHIMNLDEINVNETYLVTMYVPNNNSVLIEVIPKL